MSDRRVKIPLDAGQGMTSAQITLRIRSAPGVVIWYEREANQACLGGKREFQTSVVPRLPIATIHRMYPISWPGVNSISTNLCGISFVLPV